VSASVPGSEFLPAYEAARRRLFSRIERSCLAEHSWPARVRGAVAETLALFANDTSLAQTLVYRADAENAEARACHEETLARLAEMLRQGREEVEAPPLPEQTEESLVGGLLFIIGRSLRRGEATDLPKLTHDLTAMLLTPYLGPKDAERLAREDN
jgi:hypothetical protein